MIAGVLVGVAVMAAAVSGQTTATSQPGAAATEEAPRATLKKGGILRAVESRRAGIETLSVSFHSTSNESGDERAHYAAHIDIRGHDVVGAASRPAGGGAARRQVMIDRHYGPRDENSFHQWIAFNGRVSSWYQEYNHVGGMLPGVVRNVELARERFIQLNLLCDEGRREPLVESASLPAFLRDKFTTVRPRLEKIESAWCYVVDNGGWFHVDATLWLDPGRDFLPVRQKYFGSRKNEVTEWDVEKAEEISGKGGKFWLATAGREVLPDGAVVRVKVDRAGDAPAIRINEPLPADYFDLWKKMPAGTRVFNGQAKRTFVVGEHGELQDLAEGKVLGGEEVSPDAHAAGPGRWGIGKVLAIASVPVGFLVGSVLVLAVAGWVGMRRKE